MTEDNTEAFPAQTRFADKAAWPDAALAVLRRALKVGWEDRFDLLEREPQSDYFRERLALLTGLQAEVQREINTRWCGRP